MKGKDDMLINIGIKEGDQIFFKILDDYPLLDDDDTRQASVIFSLMTNCITRLHMLGWNEKDLIKEVFDHCEIARDIMDEEDNQE